MVTVANLGYCTGLVQQLLNIQIFYISVVLGLAPAQLYYFNRQFPTEKLQLSNDSHNLINGSRPIKILIHGWAENSERDYFKQCTNEYLMNADMDVIQVDWRRLAALPYLQAVMYTKTVGAFIAEVLVVLDEKCYNGISHQVHLIGHSLGAHVAGQAGRSFTKRTGKLLARISGLDPAGPYFDTAPREECLIHTDAAFVDITHTDGNYFGLNFALGDVDYYPNGGHRPQPGCEIYNANIYQLDPIQFSFCSHTKSYQYFIKAINDPTMIAFHCDSYTNFKKGQCNSNSKLHYGQADHVTAGKYYLDIESVPYQTITSVLNYLHSEHLQNGILL